MRLTILTTFFRNKQDVIKIYENYKKNLSSENIKYFFVNDNFQDEVWNEIEKIAKNDKNITALCFDKNYGQLSAIKSGIENIPDGNILYHDGDTIIDKSFIEKSLLLINEKEADIVWGQPKQGVLGQPILSGFFLRNVFKLIYKFFSKQNYYYKSLFLINETVLKITKNAFKGGESIIGEILTSMDVKQKFLRAEFEHNYKNSRYNFFSKFFHAIKHFTPYLENIYLKSIIASSLLSLVLLIIIILTFSLRLLGVVSFLPGWFSIILITVFLNVVVIFLVCLTSLFNIEQIKNINKKNPKIEKMINKK
tara:strand:+ start:609 stop:1532 length:924 start_codon:yes stop_codon:yes gene_type:complete